MSKRFIVGNWKMHNTVSESEALMRDILDQYQPHPSVTVAVAPSFVALQTVANMLTTTQIGVAAQNVYHEEEGAYTGEISPRMLTDVGCTYVIIGHSERRQYFRETDQEINKKIQAAAKHGLRPILCVGERWEEREAGRTLQVMQGQLRQGLSGFSPTDLSHLRIAYEPIWAIGTGRAATVEQVAEVHENIRAFLHSEWGATPDRIPILYGGSVSPANADALFACAEVDGALIGKACLNAQSFVKIIHSAR